MKLDRILQLLDQSPVIAEIHPVSLCYLPQDVTVSTSLAETVWLLDDMPTTLPGRILVTSPNLQYAGRFPQIRCDHNPFTESLNSVLFSRFDEIASHMLCQSILAARILGEARACETIVLFLIDGLSYRDIAGATTVFSQTTTIEPCLVDGPTTTRLAFSHLIGSPSLATRLFEIGYHRRLGFTYWTRDDNSLTDRLFHSIPDVRRTVQFSEVLTALRRLLDQIGQQNSKTYVQILRTGLDGYAHGQKRKVPISAVVAEICREYEQLIEVCAEHCRETERRARLYMTSDHGILWRDEFEPEVVGEAPPTSNARYCTWKELYHQRDHGRRFMVCDEDYYCLDIPKTRRQLHLDEQGVHGGISFQESIVPVVTTRIEN
jgi:hypothetical protein